MTVDDDDQSLMVQVAAGNEIAFRNLLDRHTSQVFNYVRRMIAHSAEAEDIVQETFVRLWTTRQSYNPEKAQVSTWLHRIAHNLCVDFFRRQAIQNQNAKSASDEQTQAGPEEALDMSAQAANVQRALMTLPERQRSAIVLCHYQNFSHQQAGHILNLSTDALESLLRRARSRLKTLLSKDMP